MLHSALLFSALTAMAEIPALYAQRPIVLRHERAALYHPFIESLALTFVDIPITFALVTIFAIVLYFMTGLQRSAVSIYIFHHRVRKWLIYVCLGPIFVSVFCILVVFDVLTRPQRFPFVLVFHVDHNEGMVPSYRCAIRDRCTSTVGRWNIRPRHRYIHW